MDAKVVPSVRPHRRNCVAIFLLIAATGSFLACTICGILSMTIPLNGQSVWLESDSTQIEVGARSKVAMPYDPNIHVVLEPPTAHMITTTHIIGRTPSGQRYDCDFAGEPLITLGEVSVRIWACKP
jgi:hypothetical protein